MSSTHSPRRTTATAAVLLGIACVSFGCAGGVQQAAAPREAPQPVPAFRLVSQGDGLPRSGQWRSQLAIADLNGDGFPDLAAPPARKGSGRPQIFLGQAGGGWQAWKQAKFSGPRYDYGALAALDLDRDGRLDLVLGMHLTGLAAALQRQPGHFEAADEGLNPIAPGSARPPGSLSVLALAPAANGEARFLAVYEAAPDSRAGAAIWQFAGGKWLRREVAGALPGSHASAAGRHAIYLAGGAVLGIDPEAAAPAAYRAGTLPPNPFAHALAVVHDAPLGATRGYVSISRYIGQAWHRRIERFSRLADAASQSAPLPDAVVAERTGASYYSALAARGGEPWGMHGDIVAAGDDRGAIELYRVLDGQVQSIGSLPAPEWRKGCGVSHLQWMAGGGSEPPRLAAMFSGEPSAYDLDRGCGNGGGLEVFTLSR